MSIAQPLKLVGKGKENFILVELNAPGSILMEILENL